MSDAIDADDLAMLAEGFAAVMTESPGAGEADEALFELGWGELLAAAPGRGAATAFEALGRTGSAAALLDDVVARALGIDVSPTTCVVFPAPQGSGPPASRDGDHVVLDGLVSGRIDRATEVLVSVAGADEVTVATVAVRAVDVDNGAGIDAARAYRRVSGRIAAGDVVPMSVDGTWDGVVAAARVALAHQLVAASRWMLAEARSHAIDRVQFGRPVASFQAVRHKLAEALVDIEGAASVVGACGDDPDPLLAALAKSLAGRGVRTASKHAQQVLAGIGFTTDHRFHLWMKRALVVDVLFGSASSLPTEIGHELLRRRSAPRLIEL